MLNRIPYCRALERTKEVSIGQTITMLRSTRQNAYRLRAVEDPAFFAGSGRGSFLHMPFQVPADGSSPGTGAESSVRLSERLWKKFPESLMVGRNPDFAVFEPEPSQFLVGIALCGGATNQSSNEWTDYLQSLANC